jgi:hypothetical protein
MKLNNSMLVGCAVVAALSFACNRNEAPKNENANAPAASTPGSAADTRAANATEAPMTLTGCLQKSDGIGGDYILAQATTGNGTAPIGTSGSSDSSATIGQRQQNAAERSFRLSGESDQLKDLVGHKITVSGTMADRGAIAEGKKTEDKDATSGRKIDTGDLAKVDVKSVQDVSPNCSTTSGSPKR